ncbi:MAG: hypothetical protein ACRDY5_09560, partial [Acidimicrobiales bacterium]
RQDCLAHWIELAQIAGLPVEKEADESAACPDHRSVGFVRIDGLLYEVLAGPRQRTQLVDDDGEVRWALIDAVWAEPVASH